MFFTEFAVMEHNAFKSYPGPVQIILYFNGLIINIYFSITFWQMSVHFIPIMHHLKLYKRSLKVVVQGPAVRPTHFVSFKIRAWLITEILFIARTGLY